MFQLSLSLSGKSSLTGGTFGGLCSSPGRVSLGDSFTHSLGLWALTLSLHLTSLSWEALGGPAPTILCLISHSPGDNILFPGGGGHSLEALYMFFLEYFLILCISLSHLHWEVPPPASDLGGESGWSCISLSAAA